MDIKHYYENTALTLDQIAGVTGTTYKAVWSYVARNYSKQHRQGRKQNSYRLSKMGDLNPMAGKLREQHHNYIGDVSDGKGYLVRVKPEWYTGRRRSKHVFVHQIVLCEHEGLTEVPAGMCVHHCDKNPQNNDISNLVLMGLGEHVALHSWLGATTISKESTAKWLEARRAAKAAVI